MRFTLHETDRLTFGSFVDCNMAAVWVGDRFRIFPGKYGEDPVWGYSRELKYADGATVQEAFATPTADFREPSMPPNAPPGTSGLHGAVWFETVYQDQRDASGQTLYALYHNENYPSTLPYDEATDTGYRDIDWPPGLQGDSSIQAVPRIGIMKSTDGGLSWQDNGILLEDRDRFMVRSPINLNNTFPGGVGDPSAVACGDFLYVFYGEYAYPQEWSAADWDRDTEVISQCISVARVPLDQLDTPTGAARRWDGSAFAAEWDAIGRPIRSLQIPAADGGGPVSAGEASFHWGPSVSWNTYLESWVMLMGRVDHGYWVGDSVWISFNPNADLGAHSQEWTTPELLVRRPGHTLWYPSLQPTDSAEDLTERYTCTRLGKRARLYFKDMHQDTHIYISDFEVEFSR